MTTTTAHRTHINRHGALSSVKEQNILLPVLPGKFFFTNESADTEDFTHSIKHTWVILSHHHQQDWNLYRGKQTSFQHSAKYLQQI